MYSAHEEAPEDMPSVADLAGLDSGTLRDHSRLSQRRIPRREGELVGVVVTLILAENIFRTLRDSQSM